MTYNAKAIGIKVIELLLKKHQHENGAKIDEERKIDWWERIKCKNNGSNGSNS